MNLGPAEIGLVVLAVMLLFGYKKLPDASRSLGRSLRIFKGEMNDLRFEPDDGRRPGAALPEPVDEAPSAPSDASHTSIDRTTQAGGQRLPAGVTTVRRDSRRTASLRRP